MKATVTFLLTFALLLMVISFPNIQAGKYFSVKALVDHFTNGFPEFPTLEGDILEVLTGFVAWIGDFTGWLFGFNPWVDEPPHYIKIGGMP